MMDYFSSINTLSRDTFIPAREWLMQIEDICMFVHKSYQCLLWCRRVCWLVGSYSSHHQDPEGVNITLWLVFRCQLGDIVPLLFPFLSLHTHLFLFRRKFWVLVTVRKSWERGKKEDIVHPRILSELHQLEKQKQKNKCQMLMQETQTTVKARWHLLKLVRQRSLKGQGWFKPSLCWARTFIQVI